MDTLSSCLLKLFFIKGEILKILPILLELCSTNNKFLSIWEKKKKRNLAMAQPIATKKWAGGQRLIYGQQSPWV